MPRYLNSQASSNCGVVSWLAAGCLHFGEIVEIYSTETESSMARRRVVLSDKFSLPSKWCSGGEVRNWSQICAGNCTIAAGIKTSA